MAIEDPPDEATKVVSSDPDVVSIQSDLGRGCCLGTACSSIGDTDTDVKACLESGPASTLIRTFDVAAMTPGEADMILKSSDGSDLGHHRLAVETVSRLELSFTSEAQPDGVRLGTGERAELHVGARVAVLALALDSGGQSLGGRRGFHFSLEDSNLARLPTTTEMATIAWLGEGLIGPYDNITSIDAVAPGTTGLEVRLGKASMNVQLMIIE